MKELYKILIINKNLSLLLEIKSLLNNYPWKPALSVLEYKIIKNIASQINLVGSIWKFHVKLAMNICELIKAVILFKAKLRDQIQWLQI